MASDFTISDVLAWARTKPADEEYNFCDARNCAVAQFGEETGRPQLVGLRSNEMEAISAELLDAVNRPGGCNFGALVERLQALCPEPAPSEWTRLDAYLTDIEQVSA